MSDAKTLMKNGAWVVPEADRPTNWREISLFSAKMPDSADKSEREELTEAVPAPAFDLPVPPAKYAPVFLPLFDNLLTGLQARKELLSLTHYCMSLEVALREMDLKTALSGADVPGITRPSGDERGLAE